MNFAIPTSDTGWSAGASTFTISPATAFDAIGATLTIDATTQTQYAAELRPVVLVDGSAIVAATSGLDILAAAPGSKIAGLGVGGFGGSGIIVRAGTVSITDNHVGVDALGTTALANGDHGILAASTASDLVVADNVVSSNDTDGISIQGVDASVTGNLVGLGADGSTVLGNGADGIALAPSATGATVGGATAGDRNVVGGNTLNGIDDQVGATIIGNYVGVAANGATPAPNDIGISLGGGASGAVVGRPGSEGNVVSGNTTIGILDASDGAVIRNNLVGVAADGATPAPNARGVSTLGSNTTVGGPTAGDGNTLSANTTNGLWLDGTNVTVLGNRVGTDVTGTVAVANASIGIEVVGTAVIIGGTGADDGNLISGNSFDGIRIAADDVTVLGNLIGTDTTGTAPIPNGRHGVNLRSTATAVTVGGTVAGAGNLIAHNTSIGVMSQASPTELTVVGNDIGDNGGLGIDQGFDGVTLNDSPDADGVVNFPVITTVQRVAGDLLVDLELDVAAGDYRIELFGNTTADPTGHGEGETYLGGQTITHTGSGAEAFQVTVTSPATILTATATEDLGGGSYGSTSEFSLAVPSPDLVIVNSTGDTADVSVGDGQCDTGATNALGANECTYRAALQEANDPTTPVDTIWFDIPAADAGHNAGVWTIVPGSAYPQVTAPVTIDGATQPSYVANSAAAPLPLDALPIIELDGANAGDGIHLAAGAAGSTVHALVIGGFSGGGNYGIDVNADDVTITGSVVGLHADGLTDNNNAYGIYVNGARTTIGGTAPADRNVIAGSQNAQIVLSTGTDVSILGNIIGADATTLVVPGGWGAGIQAWSGDNVTIGSVAAPNVIGSPAGEWGIEGGASNATIEGNLIGTDAGYTADIGGWEAIGGYGDAATITANVIGNFDDGIRVDALDNTVTGNFIGTDPTGTIDLGMANHGIIVAAGADNTTIGGTADADANIITNNGGAGIEVAATITDPAILINAIYANGGLGIDHDGDGVSANDAGDVDGLPNAPVLLSALNDGGVTSLEFSLDRAAGTYRIDVYENPGGADPTGYGEGEAHVTSFDIVHPGGSVTFTQPISGAAGDLLAATATSTGPLQATSEFSNGLTTVDEAGATVADQSVRRSDVIALRGAAPDQAGVVGEAFDLPGASARFRGPALDVTSAALTLAASVEADALSSDHAVISKLDSSGNVIYELSVDGTTGEAVAVIRAGGAAVTARGGTIGTAAWHDLAATWDGADLVLYVDGTEVDRVAAVGVLATDPATVVTIGNRSDRSRPLDGRIDHVVVRHIASGGDEIAAQHRAVHDAASYITVGAEQTSTPGTWTVSGTQTRSGGFALEAPQTAGADAAAWAVATGIDEPGLVFESYWWITTDTGVDLDAGTRAGLTPTDQYEAALTSPAGWELRSRAGVTESVDAAAAGTPSTGTWVRVEIWTDQLGDSRILIDGVEVTGWTSQGGTLSSGSAGLRAGLLPGGESWFVDDARARKLITPEPLTTLSSLDRN